jgi:glucosamine--fructose-6-phosphate aminotransferase (isomerizing)
LPVTPIIPHIIFKDGSDKLFATRHGAPLAIGYSENEKYIASDAIALTGLSSRISYLEEGDIAEITPGSVTIYDQSKEVVEREISVINLSNVAIGKENYRHFMQKEIFEQPSVIGDNFHAYYNQLTKSINFPKTNIDFSEIEKVTIVACGTSFYAGKTATYWIENIAKTRTEADIASEFRYRNSILPENGVSVFISQSGETADTLAALKYAKQKGQKIISIVNTVQSSIARESDLVLPIYSGPEIGVASTKAFTTQLCTLAFLALEIARQKGTCDEKQIEKITNSMLEVPALISQVLEQDDHIKEVSAKLAKSRDIMYIGRGVSFPIALEGALKIKEISYIHSEAFAAGELKHGPIALIDENVPVIAICPHDNLFDKTASNIREVAARGGKIILISDKAGIEAMKDVCDDFIEMPTLDDNKDDYTYNVISPIYFVVPTQLLAYHTAVAKGTDVDQPRNLAKSVTVE